MLCGPLGSPGPCPDELGLVTLFDLPYNAVNEDEQPLRWDNNFLSKPDPDARLLLYILAQLQLYGTTFRQIQKFNSSIADDSSEPCHSMYRFPPFDETIHTVRYESRFQTDTDVDQQLYKAGCRDYQLSAFSKFPGSLYGDPVVRFYTWIDNALNSDAGVKHLQSIFLLLQAQRVDLNFDTITDVIDDKLDGSFYGTQAKYSWHGISNPTGGHADVDALTREESLPLGSPSVYSYNALSQSKTGEGAAYRQKVSYLLADTFKLAKHLAIGPAVSNEGASPQEAMNGSDVVLIANRVIVGEDEPSGPTDDLFGPTLPYPEAVVQSPGDLPTDSSLHLIPGTSGHLTIMAPIIRLGQQTIQSLRLAYNSFGRALTRDGKVPFLVDYNLAAACMAYLSKEDPSVEQILFESKKGLPIEEFIPLWEQALGWEIDHKPGQIIHRFIYTMPEDYTIADLKGGQDGFGAGGGTITQADVYTSYDPTIVPPDAIDGWLLRSLQDTRLAFNRAIARHDRKASVEAIRQIDIAGNEFYPISEKSTDHYNQLLEGLNDVRNKQGDFVTSESVDVSLNGHAVGKADVVTSGLTLESKIIPSQLLLKVGRSDGQEYVGTVDIGQVGGVPAVTFRFNVKLVADERVAAGLRQQVESEGGSLKGVYSDWDIEFKSPNVDGLLAFNGVASGSSDAIVTISVRADAANDLLWLLAGEPGLGLPIHWISHSSQTTSGDLTVFLSTALRDSDNLVVVESTVTNNGPDRVRISWVDTGSGRIELLDPALEVLPGTQVAVGRLPILGAASLIVPPGAIRRISQNPFDVGRDYLQLKAEPMIQNVSISNLIPSNDTKLGGLKYVELSIAYQSSPDAKPLSYGPFKLAPAGANGDSVEVKVLRPADTTPFITVSGRAVYQEGSVRSFHAKDIQTMSLKIATSMFDK